jgi:hypothetical protein
VLQLALEAAVLLFGLLRRTLSQAGGRQCRQLLFPWLEALSADAQFGGDGLDGFAALEPQLHGGAFEGFVVSFVFARCVVFSVHAQKS